MADAESSLLAGPNDKREEKGGGEELPSTRPDSEVVMTSMEEKALLQEQLKVRPSAFAPLRNAAQLSCLAPVRPVSGREDSGRCPPYPPCFSPARGRSDTASNRSVGELWDGQ